MSTPECVPSRSWNDMVNQTHPILADGADFAERVPAR
jgi:hypothetical protein